jgi:hypothetical protein
VKGAEHYYERGSGRGLRKLLFSGQFLCSIMKVYLYLQSMSIKARKFGLYEMINNRTNYVYFFKKLGNIIVPNGMLLKKLFLKQNFTD